MKVFWILVALVTLGDALPSNSADIWADVENEFAEASDDYDDFMSIDEFSDMDKDMVEPVDSPDLVSVEKKLDDASYEEMFSETATPPPLTREFMRQNVMENFEAIFDINPKDGLLTKEEFAMAVQSTSQENVTYDEVLKTIDANCDGVISDLEFRGLADIAWDEWAMINDTNVDNDFYITKEELGDDELWQNLLDHDPDKDGEINLEEFSAFINKKWMLEIDHCSAPPSRDSSVETERSLDQLFDEDGGDLGDGLDKIVIYRVRVGGGKIYYKETEDGGIELI